MLLFKIIFISMVLGDVPIWRQRACFYRHIFYHKNYIATTIPIINVPFKHRL